MDAPPPISSLFDFRGRVAIVTGASGGIGAGIARRLHEAGASVVLHGFSNTTALQQLASSFHDRHVTVMGDVEVDSSRIVQHAKDTFGRVDILVNNAGIQPVAALDDIDREQAAEVLRVNVGGVIAMTKAVAHTMRQNPERHGVRGAIVNISSIEGLQSPSMHSHYAASKAAVVMHTKAAAFELGQLGIRVTGVAPGLINNGDLRSRWPEGVDRWESAAPLRRLGEPNDVADAVVFLASDAARWITGATLVVDGGVLTHNTW